MKYKNADEMLFVVDENNYPKKPLPRHYVIENKIWRRAAGAMVLDQNRKMILCHKRSTRKDERAGLWSSLFGGKCSPDEKPIETIEREVYEESGILRSGKDYTLFSLEKYAERKQFEYLYYLKVDVDSVNPNSRDSEVTDFEWILTGEIVSYLIKKDRRWLSYGHELAMINNI